MDAEIAQRFGALLKARRLACGVSQRCLAEAVQADFTYLSKIENGHIIPSPELTQKLAIELVADPLEFWEAADNTPREVLKAQVERLRSVVDAIMTGPRAEEEEVGDLTAMASHVIEHPAGPSLLRHAINQGQRLSAALAEVARLRDDLADYGKHYSSCPVGPYGEGISKGKCDCGLRDALENIADLPQTYQGAAYARQVAQEALAKFST